MTCIVGIEAEGRVLIGGDSAGVAGYSITARSDSKVWSAGPWAFGFTSSFRMGQILRYSLNLPEPTTWDIDRFMATDFVTAVRESLATHGWKLTDRGREQGGTFLVGYRDRLYCIWSDFQVARSRDGYDSVGCGYDLALGAMHATPSLTPRERLTAGLTAAAHHSAGVCAPFEIVETQADR